MFLHIFEAVRLRAAPRRDVTQYSLAAGIELHDLRHVGIDRLVVGDAGSRRVGDGDIAGAINVHDAWYAERRIRPESERVDERVVDTTVEHVDLLVALGGTH